jgi:APA family basic amino acid/polyamine antiporter
LLVLRLREPTLERPYRVSFFPLPPLIYLGLTGWTLVFVFIQRPVEALLSLGLMGFGGALFVGLQIFGQKKS